MDSKLVVSCYQNQPTTSMESITHGGVVLFVCDANDGSGCGETHAPLVHASGNLST